MRLYLVQHGEARSKDQDADRPLTEQGRRDVERMADFLQPLSLEIGRIVHSPKDRARQTAEILSKAIQAAEGLEARPDVKPTDDIAMFRKDLPGAGSDLMLVGHMPYLQRLASQLISGDASAEAVAFRKGGVVCLERGEGPLWAVCWMVVPELLS